MILHVAEYVELNWMDAFFMVCVGFQLMVLVLELATGMLEVLCRIHDFSPASVA